MIASKPWSSGLPARARVAVCALAFLLLAPPAFAAAPPNDDFANAQALAGAAVTVDGSNVDATLEPGESPPLDAARSVWYAWTAPASGRYRVETCGSAFDTVLGVYTGAALATLSPVAVNDDGCGLSSRIGFDATAGVPYRITVAGFDGDQGAFRLVIAESQPPANDAFAAAQALPGPVPLAVTGSTRDAGLEPDEPGNHGDSSVWYAWTAPAAGAYRIQTCGSATDAAPALYAGTVLGSLTSRTPYPGEDWGCPGGPGRWTVARVAAGETLRVAVGAGDAGDWGAFTLRITAEPAPGDDAFAAARTVVGTNWDVDALAVAATSEAGEPPHGGAPAARTVWVRWTAPATDRYLLEFAGNATLGLYTGSALASLAPVPTIGDPADGFLGFRATAGTEYRFALNWHELEPFPTGGRVRMAVSHGGLAIVPAALPFGAQAVGTISGPSAISLRPSPDGLASLPFDVSVQGRDAQDFLKASDTCTVAPTECAVALRFAPSAAGDRQAVLVVNTSIGPYTVPLSGTGIVPAPPAVTPVVPPPAATRPAGTATCRVARNTRRGGIVRCVVRRTPAANGTVTAKLVLGKRTRATRRVALRAGRATLRLTTRRKLSSGRYRVSLSIVVRGQRTLTLARTVRVR